MTIPIIDYACTVWGSFSLNDIGIIRRLENAAVPAITSGVARILVWGGGGGGQCIHCFI